MTEEHSPMAPPTPRDTPGEQATYLTLISVFGALAAAFSLHTRRHHSEVRFSPFDFLLLGLATYRAGLLIAGDKVMEPVRAPFTKTEGGEAGEAEIRPRGSGARRALGELLSCSTCAGTWAAAFLVYGLRVAPIPTRAILAILAATGAAEIAEKSVGALSMIGQGQRRGRT